MNVRDMASARAGDKGNTSNVVVVANDEAAFERLSDWLTAERVADQLDSLVEGPVTRYELPRVRALNFVIEGALAGGVTTSLRLDAHGKSLSFAVLGMTLSE